MWVRKLAKWMRNLTTWVKKFTKETESLEKNQMQMPEMSRLNTHTHTLRGLQTFSLYWVCFIISGATHHLHVSIFIQFSHALVFWKSLSGISSSSPISQGAFTSSFHICRSVCDSEEFGRHGTFGQCWDTQKVVQESIQTNCECTC